MKKADIKKEIIIAEARAIFAKYGLAKTTVDDIARAARMGKASLYHYFKSKEEIFNAVAEAELRTFIEETRVAVDKKNSPQEKIKTHIVAGIALLDRLPNIKSVLEDEYLDHYAFIKNIRAKVLQYEIESMKKILDEGVKTGVFKIRDIDLTSFVVVTALKSVLIHPRALALSASEREKGIDKLKELLFDGIVKR